jgi:hypothetical protein
MQHCFLHNSVFSSTHQPRNLKIARCAVDFPFSTCIKKNYNLGVSPSETFVIFPFIIFEFY